MDRVDESDITENLTVLESILVQLFEMSVEFGQLFQKLGSGCVPELFGNNVLDIDGFLGKIQSCDTTQDNDLASHIHAVQVITRIGFLKGGREGNKEKDDLEKKKDSHNTSSHTPLSTYSVSKLLGDRDHLRELDRLCRLVQGRKVVKDVAQGAREDTLNLDNLVARVDQIIQGVDDGQTRADGRLVVDQGRTRLRAQLNNLLVQVQVAGESLLVRGDDMESSTEPGWVVSSHGLVRGAVQDHGGVGGLGGGEGGREGVEGEGRGRGQEAVLPRVIAEGRVGDEHGARVGDGDDGNLFGLGGNDLANEFRADKTDSDDGNVDNHVCIM